MHIRHMYDIIERYFNLQTNVKKKLVHSTDKYFNLWKTE